MHRIMTFRELGNKQDVYEYVRYPYARLTHKKNDLDLILIAATALSNRAYTLLSVFNRR